MPAAVRPTGRARSDPADDFALRQARAMTTPESPMPQPRDIALEQETPEQAAHLEAQSDDETAESSEES